MTTQVAPALGPADAPDGRHHASLRLLVVESDAKASDALLRGLIRQGYVAHAVASGAEALRAHFEADMVLLDLDLPDLDGLEVCRRIRTTSNTPIIAVTARDSEFDRVLGLQAGSDDYIVKPYGFRELLARIEAVMRRVRAQPVPAQTIEHGPLLIDPAARRATLAGAPLDLTRKEFDLLLLLASKMHSVVSRQQIMAQVWEDTWPPHGRTVDTHVSTLRSKLGSHSWIVTVRGVGFRLGHD
ncbi:response regulator transcription factor [Streptomyces cocklensis]|jgi:DNA-binding response OmpR family regulator|uniref:Sensory transduction protein RegX3 n=1 Tax=Actinacidiphila cocklensis TaxID=887465 RepID=A0A9W4DMI9_9ACTN|nr:response regulator transcription factor [Actinacidiphila cocklensis]MDD1063050.1 response regulator transcription factor [Actinacidiphila cocklensis]WSX77124.1 response regulator transcription factor [Streptomyces sp. NBC_00899]CAG6394175.1 Sensory transduction protein RegX3 [Actinacidiphila cocklensis]